MPIRPIRLLTYCCLLFVFACSRPERIVSVDCKKGYAEAEADFNNGKLGYYPIAHIKGVRDDRFKTWKKVLSEQYGLEIKSDTGSIYRIGLCYNEFMEKKIEMKFGDDFFLVINRQVDLMYVMGKGEQRLSYQGGMDSLMSTVFCNLNMLGVLPKDSLPPSVEIRFSITKAGTADTIEVIRSFEKKYDDEALRVGKFLNKWLPVVENAQIVPTYCTLTFSFDPKNKKYCKQVATNQP